MLPVSKCLVLSDQLSRTQWYLWHCDTYKDMQTINLHISKAETEIGRVIQILMEENARHCFC